MSKMYNSAYRKRYYQEHRRHLLDLQKKYRERDKEKIKGRDKAYYQKHKERINKQSREYKKEHKGEQRKYDRKYAATRKKELKVKDKKEVLTYYGGGRCACIICGENRLGCLSIDHINGGGNEDRKKHGRFGIGLYRWLRSNDYPGGFQTLCMNCQFLKRTNIIQ